MSSGTKSGGSCPSILGSDEGSGFPLKRLADNSTIFTISGCGFGSIPTDTGFLIAFVLAACMGNLNELTISYIKTVPAYLYLGSVAGLVALIFLVIGTKKSTVMISTIVVLIGQLSMSLVLDRIFFGQQISILKVIGIFCVIAGMTFREKIIKKSQTEQENN